MSAMRPARSDEVARLWPAVKASRLMASAEQLVAFRDTAPWRVRVSDSGDALVLAPWRAHLDLLSIRGLWAAPDRVGELVADAVVVARAQGFARVLSPLLTESAFPPYARAGMEVHERIVALQGFAAETVAAHTPPGVRIRRAREADMESLEALDVRCFDEFWRYGAPELADSLSRERVVLAEDAGAIVGYATCSLHGASATVGRLAVTPSSRRRNIASALLSDAATWAAEREALALTLCTQEQNTASRALYSAVGLFEVPERYVLAVVDCER